MFSTDRLGWLVIVIYLIRLKLGTLLSYVMSSQEKANHEIWLSSKKDVFKTFCKENSPQEFLNHQRSRDAVSQMLKSSSYSFLNPWKLKSVVGVLSCKHRETLLCLCFHLKICHPELFVFVLALIWSPPAFSYQQKAPQISDRWSDTMFVRLCGLRFIFSRPAALLFFLLKFMLYIGQTTLNWVWACL